MSTNKTPGASAKGSKAPSAVPSKTASKAPTAKPSVKGSVAPSAVPSATKVSVKPSAQALGEIAEDKPEGEVEANAPKSGPVQATRSYVYVDDEEASVMVEKDGEMVKSQPKELGAGTVSATGVASMMYEKEGQWVLEKMFRKAAPMSGQTTKSKGFLKKVTNEEEDDEEDDDEDTETADASATDVTDGNKNVVGGDGAGGACGCGPVDPMIASIDAWTGSDAIPCNLCDPPKERENDLIPLWHWLYTLVTEVSAKAKAYKQSMGLTDQACGERDETEIPPGANVESLLVSTKGTQSSLAVKSVNNIPVSASQNQMATGGSMLDEKEGQVLETVFRTVPDSGASGPSNPEEAKAPPALAAEPSVEVVIAPPVPESKAPSAAGSKVPSGSAMGAPSATAIKAPSAAAIKAPSAAAIKAPSKVQSKAVLPTPSKTKQT